MIVRLPRLHFILLLLIKFTTPTYLNTNNIFSPFRYLVHFHKSSVLIPRLEPTMNTLILIIFSSLYLSTTRSEPSLFSDQDFIKTVIQKQPNRNLYLHKNPKTATLNTKIPTSFDATNKWSMCESLGKVRNHKMCGAAWAFSAVTTMSDRLCIKSNGTVKIEFSPQDLVSCCEKCGGCTVGNATEAWKFWVENGIVTGGDYGSFQGCQPYSELTDRFGEVPECDKKCKVEHPVSYHDDKHYGDFFYTIDGGAQQIQLEILTNGPVQAGLEVYEDFFKYKKGVYQRKKNSKYIGYTYVKILGWGKERNTAFWLGVTSWGTDFGSLNGYFKILRGKNEAGIEGNVVAGLPQLNKPDLVPTVAAVFSKGTIRVSGGLLWVVLVVEQSVSYDFL